MKIEKIESWVVSKWLVVRVTCEDGTYGVGEGNFWSFADATQVIANRLNEDLKGEDSRDIERIWNNVYRKFSFRSPALTAVISAIDIALWDIKGKRLGVPVWDLLGGKYRQKVRAIVLLGGGYGPTRNAEEFAAAAKKAKADGYTALKMTPFLPNWANLSYGDLIRENTRIVEAVREAVGWDFDIGIEIHRNMIPGEAITFAKNIEKFLPYFFEDPIAPDSVQSMASIADRISIPLAVGERNNTIWEFKEYSSIPGVRYLKPDIGLAGGFTHVKKFAAIAESYHQGILPHHFLGPIVNMACVHLGTSIPNWDMNEFAPEHGTFKEKLVTNIAKIQDGYFIPPEEPGLGTDIIEEEFKKYPYEVGDGETSRRNDGSIALR